MLPWNLEGSMGSSTRRRFITRAAAATVIGGFAGYSLWETHDLIIRNQTIVIPRLPAGFDGLRIAFAGDIHHGPFASLEYVGKMVERLNETRPELILLGGDYPYYEARYVTPVMEALAGLRAPLGVFGVLGNHDNRAGRLLCRQELRRNGIRDLVNEGEWLDRGGSRLYLGGVDDLWTGQPDLAETLAPLPAGEPALLMSHNPDFLEQVRDPRVLFAFCAHTHGGQVRLPLIGSPIVPSAFGQKYVYGRVRGPEVSGYVTSGVGTIFPPVRLGCPPEIALLTLQAA